MMLAYLVVVDLKLRRAGLCRCREDAALWRELL
jgi:hypothetical protein